MEWGCGKKGDTEQKQATFSCEARNSNLRNTKQIRKREIRITKTDLIPGDPGGAFIETSVRKSPEGGRLTENLLAPI